LYAFILFFFILVRTKITAPQSLHGNTLFPFDTAELVDMSEFKN